METLLEEERVVRIRGRGGDHEKSPRLVEGLGCVQVRLVLREVVLRRDGYSCNNGGGGSR